MAETKVTQCELLPGLRYSQATIKVGDTITNTTTDTNFQTAFSIPANMLKVGNIITVVGDGVYSAPAITAGTTNLKIKVGGSTVSTSPNMNNLLGANNVGFSFNARITVTVEGSSGKIQVNANYLFTNAAGVAQTSVVPSTAVQNIDTTIDNMLNISAQFSVASSSLSITLSQLLVRLEGPAVVVS